MKSQSVFSEFFYDILSYVIPGGLVVLTLFNYLYLGLYNKTADLKFLELYGSQAFKNYSWLTWVMIIVLSYLVGMMLSSLVFFLKEITEPLGYSKNIEMYLREFGQPAPGKKKICSFGRVIRQKIVEEIILCFDLKADIHNWDEFIQASSSEVFRLLRCYIQERSVLLNPLRRYRERINLVRNVVVSLFLVSLTLLWMLRGEDLSFRLFLVLGSLVTGALAFYFLKIQVCRYIENLLLGFLMLRKLETSESRVVKENSLLRERLDQVERDIKKQRSSTDVISQLAHHFMPPPPTKDKK